MLAERPKIFQLNDAVRTLIQEAYMTPWGTAQMSEGQFYKDSHYYHPTWKEFLTSTWGASYHALLVVLKDRVPKNEDQPRIFIANNNMRCALSSAMEVGYFPIIYGEGEQLEPTPEQLYSDLEIAEAQPGEVIVLTPIGGFITENFIKLLDVAHQHQLYIIIDAAHAASLLSNTVYYGDEEGRKLLNYYDRSFINKANAVIYSFNATKPLPAGEGSVIAFNPYSLLDIPINFAEYMGYGKKSWSRPYGTNLRVDEAKGSVIHALVHSQDAYELFIDRRRAVASAYQKVYEQLLSPEQYLRIPEDISDQSSYLNGYKSIVYLDIDFGVLNTSKVFDRNLITDPHVPYGTKDSPYPVHSCPATYNTLYDRLDEACAHVKECIQHYLSTTKA